MQKNRTLPLPSRSSESKRGSNHVGEGLQNKGAYENLKAYRPNIKTFCLLWREEIPEGFREKVTFNRLSKNRKDFNIWR